MKYVLPSLAFVFFTVIWYIGRPPSKEEVLTAQSRLNGNFHLSKDSIINYTKLIEEYKYYEDHKSTQP